MINESAEEKVTAIYVMPTLDALLGYQDGRVVYVRDKGGFPQTTPNNLCNRDFEHGPVNFIDYVLDEELVVIGFTNGVVHIMKVHAQHFSNMFLRGFYCCNKENNEVLATGCYAVVNKPAVSQMEVWCGCSNSHLETWNFHLPDIPKWRQALVKKTSSQLSLRHTKFTACSSVVYRMSVMPDYSSVFALIGNATNYGIVAICQVDAANKTPLRYWQCEMGNGK